MRQFNRRQKKREKNHDLYLILIYPDVSDYCVYYGVRMGSYKTGRERDVQEVAQTERERERDLGEVSTLQQETLQSAFNHSMAPPPPSLQTERRTATAEPSSPTTPL